MATGAGKRFGVDIYAPALHVVERTEGRRSDRGPVRTRELPVAGFNRIRTQTNEQFVVARRFSLRLRGINRILGRELPYGFLPAGVSFTTDFVPLRLATETTENALLNVYCVRGPFSFANEDCYHTYQIYAR